MLENHTGCRSTGHSKVRGELTLKTKVIASTHPFVWKCLGLQVNEQQNPYAFTTACFSTCQDRVHSQTYLFINIKTGSVF